MLGHNKAPEKNDDDDDDDAKHNKTNDDDVEHNNNDEDDDDSDSYSLVLVVQRCSTKGRLYVRLPPHLIIGDLFMRC